MHKILGKSIIQFSQKSLRPVFYFNRTVPKRSVLFCFHGALVLFERSQDKERLYVLNGMVEVKKRS